ncbi:MAG: Hsp20/alpha crystallin family protein [Bacilli bacterium]|nr:Hsp20/alpha crystallin family protein [Bacilli bacterium]MDD4388643.1 Hsp20/alpha crystallin family protein [Bacilli bacterium]
MFNLMIRKNKKRDLGLFDDPFFSDFFDTPLLFDDRRVMRTDLREEDNRYLLDIELPGLNKQDIKLSLEDGYLTVDVVKEESKEQKDDKGNYVRRERHYGNCSRTFYLGDVKEADITANYNNGILTVSVPKAEAVDKKKYIEIE